MKKDAFLQELNGLSCENKSATQLYNEISALAVKYIEPDERPKRCAHYLSIEFLIGRVFYNNLLELGVLGDVAKILKKKGVDIAVSEEIEDAELGNGGFGRLAAGYMVWGGGGGGACVGEGC